MSYNPKILCIMLTWNNFEFFKRSLQQALDFCDEVILIEGCNSKQYPIKSIDGTYEYVEKLRQSNNKKLKIYTPPRNIARKYDTIQRRVRENYPMRSKLWKPGNWVIQWDDDIFFFKTDLEKIKERMVTTKEDSLRFQERRFIYNFRFNTFTGKMGAYHFDRITAGAKYRFCMLKYRNGTYYVKYDYLSEIVYHHYTYVKNPKRINARWVMSLEKGNFHNKDNMKMFNQIHWKEDKDIFKYQKTIEHLNAEKGLNIYTGPHPKILDNHPWRYINDCRLEK